MTRKLEEEFNLPPIEDVLPAEKKEEKKRGRGRGGEKGASGRTSPHAMWVRGEEGREIRRKQRERRRECLGPTCGVASQVRREEGGGGSSSRRKKRSPPRREEEEEEKEKKEIREGKRERATPFPAA